MPDSGATHRDLAHLGAAWLLDQRWCWIAAWEVQGDGVQFDAIGVTPPIDEALQAAVRAESEEEAKVIDPLRDAHWEKLVDVNDRLEADPWNEELNAEAIKLRRSWPSGPPHRFGGWPVMGKQAESKARVSVLEAKRTRADLMQDLRARKMLGYEHAASHCYLAATHAALKMDREIGARGQSQRVLAELTTKGLPTRWGVLLLPSSWDAGPLPVRQIVCLRAPKRIQPITAAETRFWTMKIGRSLSYRAMRET